MTRGPLAAMLTSIRAASKNAFCILKRARSQNRVMCNRMTLVSNLLYACNRGNGFRCAAWSWSRVEFGGKEQEEPVTAPRISAIAHSGAPGLSTI
jgi:hypothetical protein